MVSSITGQQSSSILTGILAQGTTPSGSTASFTDQLAAALEGYLAQSSNGSNLEIDIQTTQSQNSGVRQFIVTVKDPGGAPAQTAAAAGTTASTGTPAITPAAVPTTPMTEVDAYWAAQPPAVQQLRDLDFADRCSLAQKLADQGYSIDNAIMVHRWDPLGTMQIRQMYGYTWFPGYNYRGNCPVPGSELYDPNNPPPGSIKVTTDFASGLGITNPSA